MPRTQLSLALPVVICHLLGNPCGAQEPAWGRVYYFSHLEIGYTSNGGHHIPDPEYSGPENTRALEELDRQIAPGLMEEALRKAIDVLEHHNQKGLFLAFPYYAESHGGRELRRAIEHGHLVGIHLHEDWKRLASRLDVEELASYIRREKERLERAVGTRTIIFSYGPGIQLDDMGGRETPPQGGSLSYDEKMKLFDAVHRAGFRLIQAPREYYGLLPPDLKPLEAAGIRLESIGHSFEWHDQHGVLKEFAEKLKNLDRPLPAGVRARPERPR